MTLPKEEYSHILFRSRSNMYKVYTLSRASQHIFRK